MKTLMITEKTTQAANWRKALGPGDPIKILPAQGHLIRIDEPKEDNPAYREWTDVVLTPTRGRYATREDLTVDGAHKLVAIREALKTADSVVIATDCDREGQLIGEEIVRHYGYKGPVRRAMYSAEDPKSLRDALANAKDNAFYSGLYEAAVARQQADQIFNLSMTRIATVSLRPDGSRAVFGVGRVKTATLGIIYALELEIRNFRPVTFFDLSMAVEAAAGTATLAYAPRNADRVVEKARADAIAAAARAWRGPLKVTRDVGKRAAPPRPYDLGSLQVKAGAWGWTPKRTEDVAQSLYETHGVTTYPRSETRYLPENFIPDAQAVLDGLRAMPEFAGYPLSAPVIRTGKDGVFCDAELSGKMISHHAIVPNVNAPAAQFGRIHAKLDADERRLFELIARGFLACVGEDQVYDQTTVSAEVRHGGARPDPVTFSAVGRVTTSPGWKAAFAGSQDDGEEDDDAGKGAGGKGAGSPAPVVAAMPPFRDGEPAEATSAAAKQQATKPPQRLTEATLMREMKNPGRHVSDPAERKRIGEAKGIGTASTRKDVPPGLKAQKFIEVVAGKIAMTDAGMEFCAVVSAIAPELLDVGATARMEMRLDDVALSKATADEVIAETVARTERLRAQIVAAGLTTKITGATTADRSFVKGARKAPAKGAPAATPAAPPARAPAGVPAGATRLAVPFKDKDEAKGLGARWSGAEGTWYAPAGTDLGPLDARGWVSKRKAPEKARA